MRRALTTHGAEKIYEELPESMYHEGDVQFDKFRERVERSPEQCLRCV